jgi:cytochrome P450
MPCPVFPRPGKTKTSLIKAFFSKRRSLLDGLYERSYRMKMGEVRLPGFALYMVNQPDLVRRIMADDVARFPKHRLLGEMLEPLLGQSIFTTNGAQWRKQRDMLDPAFEFARVQHVFGLMQEAAEGMMERLSALDADQPFDIDPEMTFVTADIIFRTILSAKLEPGEARRILDAFAEFQRESPKVALARAFRVPSWMQSRAALTRRKSAANIIRQSLGAIILPRYEQAQLGAPPRKEEPSDILGSILRAVDPDTGKPFTFPEVVDQVSMLFLAGHETSASALTWALYLLAIHPRIQGEAQAEIDRVVGSAAMTPAHMRRLPLLREIFREALRLYPPVGFFVRETTEAIRMRDKVMRQGSTVIVSPWLIHRHEEFWDHPELFDPRRFSRGEPKCPARDGYLPFSTGPRVCIGASFAQQEATLILASILRSFEISLAEGFVPDPVGRLTIRSDNGMVVRLRRRQPAQAPVPAARLKAQGLLP